MHTEDQTEILRLLGDPATHGGGVGEVERIDTHISAVFLAGDRAYKLKRAVRFPYLDFSTVERRKAAAETEVALNRRTAPALYLGTVPVTRTADGRLELDGAGEPIEWLVLMRRFDQETLFDRLAAAGALDDARIEELAAIVARFHREAEPCEGGGSDALRAVARSNARAFHELPGGILDPEAVATLLEGTGRRLERDAALLDRRAEAGLVRRCHGDLHLRNICLVEDRPTLFDALEFDPALACIDVWYDLAFLLMDLVHRRLDRAAALLFNRYLEDSRDDEGLAVLPLFLSLRAAIRAHVTAVTAESITAVTAEGAEPTKRAALVADARAYLDLARRALRPAEPRLVAVGGLSGTGKSTLARGLAPGFGPPPGAAVLRSDVIRKELAGVDRLTRLGPEGYERAVTERVYETLRRRAGKILSAGHSVIADAVYARPEERTAIEAIAHEAGVPFDGLWLEAPPDRLEERIAARRGDASDATVAVLRGQRKLDLGALRWHRIEAGGPPGTTLAQARRRLGGAH